MTAIDLFSNLNFNIINFIINTKKIILAILFSTLNVGAKRKAHSCAKSREDRAKINQQAEHLLEVYGNSILRLAYSYLHNMSDAEDILQDTIIQYIKAKPNFESSMHEKAWLMRVAINLSKNKVVYNKKRETLEIDENLFIENEKDLKFVWDAVRSLPTKYSEVIHLFYHEGYTTVQIADMLSKKEATVRSLLHRGRERLKEILKEVYDFDE